MRSWSPATIYDHREITLHAMVEAVRRQLHSGQAVIVFDETTETCTIVLREARPPEYGYESHPNQ